MNDIPALTPGCTGSAELQVQTQDLATSLGSGTVEVLGTPRLVALLEQATVAAVAAVLPSPLTTVGVHVDVSHLAASAPGEHVMASATLLEVDGRMLAFAVVAHDSRGRKVGEGRIRRAIVDAARFQARISQGG